jgi:hypothetical protein
MTVEDDMRILRFLVNWLAILTVPVWGGFLLLWQLVSEFHRSDVQRCVTGKEWIWE